MLPMDFKSLLTEALDLIKLHLLEHGPQLSTCHFQAMQLCYQTKGGVNSKLHNYLYTTTTQREASIQKYTIIYNSAFAHSNVKNPKTDILKEGEQPHLTPLKVTTEHDSRYLSSSQNNIKTLLRNFIKHVALLVYMHFCIKLVEETITTLQLNALNQAIQSTQQQKNSKSLGIL